MNRFELRKKIFYLKRNFLEKFFSLLGRPIILPTNINLEMTDCCNSRCRYCNMWRLRRKKKELNFQQKKQLIKDLKSWLGIFKINLSGGEPFLDSQLMELVEFCRHLGVITTITTNGLLIEREKIPLIVETGLQELVLAINGAEEATHDWTTGVKGSYHQAWKVIDAIRIAKERKKQKTPLLFLNCVVMKKNLAELEKLVYLAQEKGVDGINFIPVWLKEEKDRSLLWPDKPQLVKKSLEQLIKLKSENFPINNSINNLKKMKNYFGRKSDKEQKDRKEKLIFFRNFHVDAVGNVRFYFRWPKIGNLTRQGPKEIWWSQSAQKQRQEFLKNNDHLS